MTVSFKDMESKLLTLDQVVQTLQKTEPLSNTRITNEDTIRFNVEPDWTHELKTAGDTDRVGMTMTINGTTRPLTKEAALQAGANFGLPSPYVKKLPGRITEGLLNYHYGQGMNDKAYSVLAVGDEVSAFTRPSLTTYSNIELLEKVVEGIQALHGPNTRIFADYKMSNTLHQTNVRLILPDHMRVIDDTRMDDVPTGFDDTWVNGLHLSNSLIGQTQTSLEGYMFRWWCTNGATATNKEVGTWSRRAGGAEEDVYEWARKSVDDVLGGMEHRFDQIQALAQLDVNASAADVLREIFDQYHVPVSQRDEISQSLISQNRITLYHIMQAITAAANGDLEDNRRDRLMRIGGALPTATFDPLKARVWREGHLADKTSRNPYEPLVLTVL